MVDEELSEATEIQKAGHNMEAVQYGAGQEAIGNQLELASMVSGGNNSVMGSSPVRPQRS